MKKLLLHIMWVLGCTAAQAQSVQQVEQDILGHLKHIQYWRFEYSPEDTIFKSPVNADDSIAVANQMLLEYLVNISGRQPQILRYEFKLPENSDMKIATSDDGRIRMFSWDTHTGEHEHDYHTVYMYLTGSGIKALPDMQFNNKSDSRKPAGNCYQKIYLISDGYYLAVSSDMLNDNNTLKKIVALKIDGTQLQPATLFSNDGQLLQDIQYTYNYSSNYDFRKMKEEFDVRYENSKLIVPEVADYKMTGKYKVYNFNGEKFVLDKNAK